MDWQIIGHKQQLERLSKAVESAKLAHGYLFAGPVGVGKKTVARRLSQILLGIRKPRPDFFHPDHIEVASDGEIKIAQIREVIYKLSLKPYSAAYKVAVIDQAHQLNAEAANALLKSLEEPKPNTIIILVTSSPQQLPKTILSRVQKITFGALTAEELKQLPQADERLLAKRAEAEEYYDKVFPVRLAEKLALVQELADLETADLKILFFTWLQRFQTKLRQTPTRETVDQIAAVAEADKLLDQNVNSKLLLANLMIKI